MRTARSLLLAVLFAPAAAGQSLTGLAERSPVLMPPPVHDLSYVHAAGPLAPLGEGGRTELEWGDVNGDGHPDLVGIGDHGSPEIGTQQHGVMTWLGDGAGGFSVFQVGDFGYGGLALGDVDGDGLLDVGYAMHHDYAATDLGDQLIEVALGDGTGAAWLPWDDGLATAGETYGMFGTDLGDVDADGDLDLGSNSFGCCAGVHVYLNGGSGSWTPSWGFTGGNSNMDFLFADFDGDGSLDACAANSLGTLWLGDGTGGFAAADGNLPASNWSGGLAAADVDGDGADELGLVVGGGLQVWRHGPGNAWTPLSTGLPATGWQALQLLDLDADGACDLLAFGSGNLKAWRGDGAGGWAPEQAFTTPGGGAKTFRAFRAGADLDHNGYPDFALVQDEGGGFSSANRTRVFREASQAGGRSLRVTAPGPGRTWRAGQVRAVEWLSAVPPGEPLGSVSVELSLAGLGGPWELLAAGLPDNGRAQVVVPAGVTAQHAWVRVRVQAAGHTGIDVGGPLQIVD
jgi:hypothetical protein